MRVYDLAFSLGANCSAANNLKRRGLRPFSLPFDWVYFTDESTLTYLAENIKNRFADLMLKENLREITPDNPEWVPSHGGFLKYHDLRSGYRFVNHFRKSIDIEGEYERVHATLRRRIDRLFAAIEKGNDFLLVLGTRAIVSVETLKKLRQALLEVFPTKRFDFEVLQFNAPENNCLKPEEGMAIHCVMRDWNAYDPEQTNYEWHFLDDIKSKTKPRRSQISFHLFPRFKITIGWKKC